jgi:hypothetical protein
MKMKALSIIIKTTSSFDTLLPIVEYSKKEDMIEWSVLTWRFNKNNVLNNTEFSKSYLEASGINLFDLPEVISNKNMLLKLLNLLSKQDNRLLKFLYKATLKIFDKVLQNTINPQEIIDSFSPDVILLDHRSDKSRGWVTNLPKYLSKIRTPVILMPHAPHHTSTDRFTPVLDTNPIPSNFEYWMPFKFDQYWRAKPELKEKFFYSGYPGLCSANEWLKLDSQPRINNQPKVLFIIRKFFPKRIKSIPKGHDAFAFLYCEFEEMLNNLIQQLKIVFNEFEIDIKPHPSTDQNLLSKMIKKYNCKNISVNIRDESIYNVINDYDIFISLYSTTLLIPILAGKPTVVINTRIQDEFKKEPHINQLYKNLSFYTHNNYELNKALVRIGNNHFHEDIKKDQSHIKSHFVSESPRHCTERILRLASN